MARQHDTVYEYYLNELSKVLNTKFVRGVITQKTAVNYANVLLDDNRSLNGIEIKYNIPDGSVESMNEGGNAFQNNDRVILFELLNTFYIIAHEDGLHPGLGLKTLFSIIGYPVDIYYNSVTQKLYLYIVDPLNPKILETNLLGTGQSDWITSYDFGAGAYNVLYNVDNGLAIGLEMDTTNSKLYFAGKHNFIPSITSWEENAPIGGYDEQLYPVVLFPSTTLTKTYRIRFDSTTNFTCYNMTDGGTVVGTGTINSNFVTPYFKIKSGGWYGTWIAGDMIDFSTMAASGSGYIEGVFKDTFNVETTDFFIYLGDLKYVKMHYCNQENVLYVLGWNYVSISSTYNLVLRKYDNEGGYIERTLKTEIDVLMGDFCHDCAGGDFYIQYYFNDTVYRFGILKYNWESEASVDWSSIAWLFSNSQERAGIAFNTNLSRLYVVANNSNNPTHPVIVKANFNTANYDEISVVSGINPYKIKFLNGALYISNVDGTIMEYKE